MCSINGFLNFGKKYKKVNISEFLISGMERGRDSFGVYTKTFDNIEQTQKCVDSSSPMAGINFIKEVGTEVKLDDIQIYMNNMRAEPTSESEWIKEKTVEDTQPFVSKKTAIIHNGTIANDNSFNKIFEHLEVDGEYRKGRIKIDSSVFLNVLHGKDLEKALREQSFVGSFGCCQYFKNSNTVYLFKNYMPLYIMVDYDNEIIWFASLKETLLDSLACKVTTRYNIIDMPAYSYIKFNLDDTFDKAVEGLEAYKIQSFLYPDKKVKRKLPLNDNVRAESKPKSLVVCSGGLDSTTVATLASKKYKEDVTLLHFLYNCKAQEKELQAIKNIAKELICKYVVIDLSTVFNNFLQSNLTKESNTKISEKDRGIEYAYEWVPARNLILMSIAIGYAEKNKFTTLYLGANLDEASAYPDNSIDFIDKLNTLIPYSVQNGVRLKIKKPISNMMKHEIVRLAIDIEAPLDKMWSCYHGGKYHCGKCGPCQLRKIAFSKNDIEDTYIKYEEE